MNQLCLNMLSLIMLIEIHTAASDLQQSSLLVSEGTLEDLRLELAPEQLARLVLWQRLHEHDAGGQPLVWRDVLRDVVDDVLLEDVAVLADDVGARQLARAVVRHANYRHVVHP